MIDKEKVFKGLQCCDYSNSLKFTCFQCPYIEINRAEGMANCTAYLAHDALQAFESLLYFESKDKHEAPVMAGSNVYSGIWLCPRCRSELTKITGTKTVFAGIPNYCPYCGQRLKLPNETVQVPEPE
jgi:hypothetical protein